MCIYDHLTECCAPTGHWKVNYWNTAFCHMIGKEDFQMSCFFFEWWCERNPRCTLVSWCVCCRGWCLQIIFLNYPRPHAKPADRNAANKMDVGIADDQARDFDFVKTEMKYDSTGMFHWIPARSIEDCILVSSCNWDYSPHSSLLHNIR